MPVRIPQILLPNKDIDLNLWSVVACDQFTQDLKYWQELDGKVGKNPSTLRLILPEIFLEENNSMRTENINKSMRDYLANGLFGAPVNSFILVERTYLSNVKRYGIIIAVDLEKYSFNPDQKQLIRATEGTILDRLPPRVEIRKNAPLEFPHIMLLIDDVDKTVIESQVKKRESLQKLYDFTLNMGGGNVKGYKIDDNNLVVESIKKLLNKKLQTKKYGRNEQFLFAVGDGNHSLATAKMCWENLKGNLNSGQIKDHPARFALCEVVNIYDEGLVFEPIHRYIYDIEPESFINSFKGEGTSFVTAVYGKNTKKLNVPKDFGEAVNYIDTNVQKYLEKNSGKVDYIHGDYIKTLAQDNLKSVGIIMPKLDKSKLFLTVANNGCLPRKSFSMGEAEEKRYYLEGKKIVKE